MAAKAREGAREPEAGIDGPSGAVGSERSDGCPRKWGNTPRPRHDGWREAMFVYAVMSRARVGFAGRRRRPKGSRGGRCCRRGQPSWCRPRQTLERLADKPTTMTRQPAGRTPHPLPRLAPRRTTPQTRPRRAADVISTLISCVRTRKRSSSETSFSDLLARDNDRIDLRRIL